MNRIDPTTTRRAASPAYDAGYLACERGLPCECPVVDGKYRAQWYTGWLDAKYPESKYEIRVKQNAK